MQGKQGHASSANVKKIQYLFNIVLYFHICERQPSHPQHHSLRSKDFPQKSPYWSFLSGTNQAIWHETQTRNSNRQKLRLFHPAKNPQSEHKVLVH